MLSDEVISEIDRIAHRKGMTRSALVNAALAEYAEITTPEKRINDIFSYIEHCFGSHGDIVPSLIPNQTTMSLKSSLDYRYRPTVRYEVELYGAPGTSIGRLSVIFRTQSAELLESMMRFFRLWERLEGSYLSKLGNLAPAEYGFSDGKFTRSISLVRDKNYTSSSVGNAISEYVGAFDELMKDYLCGKYTPADVENRYIGYLNSGVCIL